MPKYSCRQRLGSVIAGLVMIQINDMTVVEATVGMTHIKVPRKCPKMPETIRVILWKRESPYSGNKSCSRKKIQIVPFSRVLVRFSANIPWLIPTKMVLFKNLCTTARIIATHCTIPGENVKISLRCYFKAMSSPSQTSQTAVLMRSPS